MRPHVRRGHPAGTGRTGDREGMDDSSMTAQVGSPTALSGAAIRRRTERGSVWTDMSADVIGHSKSHEPAPHWADDLAVHLQAAGCTATEVQSLLAELPPGYQD